MINTASIIQQMGQSWMKPLPTDEISSAPKLDNKTQQRLLRELREAMSDLRVVNPWSGFFRFVSLGSATVCMGLITWQMSGLVWFMLGAIATSIIYAFWLICNHDATHRTLTGWTWFDTLMPRVISWPMMLPIGTYNQLHHLHHGYNGINLKDPERVQWTEAEYQVAPFYQRWYVRHQWVIDILIFGSVGLVLKTMANGVKLQGQLADLRQQMLVDCFGILSVQIVIVSLLSALSVDLWRYLLFWVILERGIGFILQARDHLEHYGMWQKGVSWAQGNYQLTQLYACRNIKTLRWINWLMGGLPYHAVHHAFPQIASEHLAEAFERIQAILQRYAMPAMVLDSGYVATSLRLSRQPRLVGVSTIESA